MILRVANKHTRHRSWREFVRAGGCGIWVTKAPKYSQGGVVRIGVIEKGVGSGQGTWLARFAIVLVSGCVQSLDQKDRWEAGVQKQCTNAVVQSAQHTFRFAVLLRGVRARKSE